jgi:hypothetical protein
MKFKTKIFQSGNNTGIVVPEKIVESFSAGRKPPVVITLTKYTYCSTVVVMGGKYLVSLSAENRKNAKVADGDEVDITIDLDTEPRPVELPGDLKKHWTKIRQPGINMKPSPPVRRKQWSY